MSNKFNKFLLGIFKCQKPQTSQTKLNQNKKPTKQQKTTYTTQFPQLLLIRLVLLAPHYLCSPPVYFNVLPMMRGPKLECKHAKAFGRSAAPEQNEGGNNVAKLIRCQVYVVPRHIYHIDHLPPGGHSCYVKTTLGLHFSVTAGSFDHDYAHLNEQTEVQEGCSADRQVSGWAEGSI